MNLASIRLITADMDRMVRFYEQATGLRAVRHTEDFAEFPTPGGILAIGSERTVRLFGEGVARAADNRTVIVEFRVEDVDREFDRLKGVVVDFVQTPTTMPWGNRSLLFRDPDENLINFFTPLTPEAIARQSRSTTNT